VIQTEKTAFMFMLAAICISSCSDQPATNAKTAALPLKIVTPADTHAAQLPSSRPPASETTRSEAPPKAVSSRAPKMDPLAPPFERSTLSGVYSAADARDGRDLYLGYCASCHAAVSHTGPAFRQKWAGRPLSDLFMFMRTNMPKNDPASLGDDQYGVLLAYLLQMNKMPPGKTPLSPDSANLAKIRIDTVRAH
jgi:mono/diheme cytochrome c family protein